MQTIFSMTGGDYWRRCAPPARCRPRRAEAPRSPPPMPTQATVSPETTALGRRESTPCSEHMIAAHGTPADGIRVVESEELRGGRTHRHVEGRGRPAPLATSGGPARVRTERGKTRACTANRDSEARAQERTRECCRRRTFASNRVTARSVSSLKQGPIRDREKCRYH
jgi:hypothetical protein